MYVLLGCRIHIMCGKKYDGCDVDKMEATFVENLKYASEVLSPVSYDHTTDELLSSYNLEILKPYFYGSDCFCYTFLLG